MQKFKFISLEKYKNQFSIEKWNNHPIKNFFDENHNKSDKLSTLVLREVLDEKVKQEEGKDIESGSKKANKEKCLGTNQS